MLLLLGCGHLGDLAHQVSDMRVQRRTRPLNEPSTPRGHPTRQTAQTTRRIAIADGTDKV